MLEPEAPKPTDLKIPEIDATRLLGQFLGGRRLKMRRPPARLYRTEDEQHRRQVNAAIKRNRRAERNKVNARRRAAT